MLKKVLIAFACLILAGIISLAAIYLYFASTIPATLTMEDFKPLLVTQVYDRNEQKIGEFFRERRILVPYEEMPELLVKAFLAAEDDQFFSHNGVNPSAILRAAVANFRAGRTVQGGSTITQQVAKRLALTSERTYTRKIREAILAMRMENHLTKEEILSLYLNEIFLGHHAYGVEAAAQAYFRKTVKELTLPEVAMLAGLPQAPSAYSPVRNPGRAKDRQRYVLDRMASVGYITEEEAIAAKEEPLKVYLRADFQDLAPFYLETLRQLLVAEVGEKMVLDQGLRVYTSLDSEKQRAATKELREGLREVDKRQGFRGAHGHIADSEQLEKFLLSSRDTIRKQKNPYWIIEADGTVEDLGPLDLSRTQPIEERPEEAKELANLPNYIEINDIVEGVVTRVDDKWGLVYVQFAEAQGIIDVETMKWARKPDPERFSWQDQVNKPSEALKKGDVIWVRVEAETFSSGRVQSELAKLQRQQGKNYSPPKDLPDFKLYTSLLLEQEPEAEASLISFDQETQEVLALVGGYDFERSEFNRALQAARQTGSSYKAVVYAAALDKNYTPATPIIDAPIVYFDEDSELTEGQEGEKTEEGGGEAATQKAWRPANHSRRFGGDILFRNALIRSLNIPTIKIIEDLGVNWVMDYSRRLGVISPLNPDYTLALGSSGSTLYEMTKVFSQFGRMGKRIRPLIIHRVEDAEGNILLENVSLDQRFRDEIKKVDEYFEELRQKYLEEQAISTQASAEADAQDETEESEKELKSSPFFFDDPDQLIDPKTAYLVTNLLRAAVNERGGTGGRARALGREVAGKTGTTNGYYDAWFIGYTPQVATGVWVGFDNERSLGKGFVGGNTALPIWLEYMKAAHQGLPNTTFPVPEGIVFANIDKDTGKLASASSSEIVRQPFVEGTEPSSASTAIEDQTDFYKQDLE